MAGLNKYRLHVRSRSPGSPRRILEVAMAEQKKLELCEFEHVQIFTMKILYSVISSFLLLSPSKAIMYFWYSSSWELGCADLCIFVLKEAWETLNVNG